MAGSNYVAYNLAQTRTDAEKLQARNNIGAAALASLAPAFSTSTAYNEGDVVTYNGKLYVFTADKAAGAWDDTKANETTIWEVLQMAADKPTTIVSGPIMKDSSGTGKELYTYANNARTASVTLSQDQNMVLLLKAGALGDYAAQTTFKPNKKLIIKRARLVTPGSEGIASANGYNAGNIYFTPYDYTDTGSVYGMTITKYNEWEDVNLEVDGTSLNSDWTLKLYSAYNDNGNTRSTELRVDDYNLQSAYAGQKLQVWLELEVEADGIA